MCEEFYIKKKKDSLLIFIFFFTMMKLNKIKNEIISYYGKRINSEELI